MGLRVKRFLFGPFQLLNLLPQVFVVVHKVHLVLWWVEIHSLCHSRLIVLLSASKLRIASRGWHRRPRDLGLIHGGLGTLLTEAGRFQVALGASTGTEASRQSLLLATTTVLLSSSTLSFRVELKGLLPRGDSFKTRVEALCQRSFLLGASGWLSRFRLV